MAESLRTPSLAPNYTGGFSSVTGGTITPEITKNFLGQDGRPKNSLTPGFNKLTEGVNAVYQVQVQATAKEMDNNFSQAAQQTLYDANNGYYNKHGKDAVTGYQDAVKQLKTGFQQSRESVSDPTIQRVYQTATGDRMNQMLAQMQEHYSKGVYEWNVNETKARIKNLGDLGVRNLDNWNSEDGAFMKAKNAVMNEVFNLAKLNGTPTDSASFDQLARASLTTFHKTALDSFLANTDVRNAQGYWNKFYKEMDAEDAEKYKGKIMDMQARLEAKALRDQARRDAAAAKANKPENLLAAVNQEYINKKDALNEAHAKGKLDDEQFNTASDQLNFWYTNTTEGIVDGVNINKATEAGEKARFKHSVINTRIMQFQDAILNGQVTSLDQIFSIDEMQKIDANGQRDYVNNMVFHRNTGDSKRALSEFKAMDNLTDPNNLDKSNALLARMLPSDEEAAFEFKKRKLSGKDSKFDAKVNEYALSIIGITDGKKPREGTPEYTRYINVATDLTQRVKDIIGDKKLLQHLDDKTMVDVLNSYAVTYNVYKPGMLWGDNKVSINDTTGRPNVISGSFVKVSNGEEEVKIPVDFYEQNIGDIISNKISGYTSMDGRKFAPFVTGEGWDKDIAELMISKWNNYKATNTTETNAILGDPMYFAY